MKALVKPSSLFKVQLRTGLQQPPTGAYPEGPPKSNRVNHIAKSCRDSPGSKMVQQFSTIQY